MEEREKCNGKGIKKYYLIEKIVNYENGNEKATVNDLSYLFIGVTVE